MSVEMPLADMARRITAILKQLRQRDLAGSQMNLASFGNPREDSVSIRSPPREDRRPRRTAHRACRIELSEPRPLLCKRIEMRCLDDWMSVTTQVAIAEVIGEKNHDILRDVRGECRSHQREKGREDHQTLSKHEVDPLRLGASAAAAGFFFAFFPLSGASAFFLPFALPSSESVESFFWAVPEVLRPLSMYCCINFVSRATTFGLASATLFFSLRSAVKSYSS